MGWYVERPITIGVYEFLSGDHTIHTFFFVSKWKSSWTISRQGVRGVVCAGLLPAKTTGAFSSTYGREYGVRFHILRAPGRPYSTEQGRQVLADYRATFPEVARAAGSRIVSGWEADEGQFPHQFSLRMINPIGQVFACGGSIISSGWGLTAAHCTASRISFVIRAGVVNLTRPGVIFETTDFFNHPLYNNNLPGVVQPHDIGLLRFNRDLEFSDTIQPIRLQRSADKDVNYAGEIAIASGWGNTWTGGKKSCISFIITSEVDVCEDPDRQTVFQLQSNRKLQVGCSSSPENLNWVYLTLTSNAACWAAFGFSPIIQPSTICAASYNVTSQSTCQGDSGGPLTIVEDDGIITQVGVTSFVSITGCHTDIPAGFIRPGHYHDWFTEVSGIDFDFEQTEPETTEDPEDGTTEAVPEESTTEAAPEESTTEAAPEESTTEAVPEESTTAEPETTVTAAPETVPTTEANEDSSESSESSESSSSSSSSEED
ncbi:unnamed protein product [Chrysodeixis includens]|uniref:Peptidase S1 domain-containing protein n=1 Tax=Chrysodeixis includens TaxID=689277 RepID=A0A9N8L4W7_CHRIL|nr:unnamed protein product [Chrysodeixis includens]